MTLLSSQRRVVVIYNRDFEGAEADPENRAREDVENVATHRITIALTSEGSASTPAVRRTLPPVIVVRNASLSARIFSALTAGLRLAVARIVR